MKVIKRPANTKGTCLQLFLGIDEQQRLLYAGYKDHCHLPVIATPARQKAI